MTTPTNMAITAVRVCVSASRGPPTAMPTNIQRPGITQDNQSTMAIPVATAASSATSVAGIGQRAPPGDPFNAKASPNQPATTRTVTRMNHTQRR